MSICNSTLSDENFNLAYHVYKYSLEMPDAIAIAGENESITYEALAKRASQLAHFLKNSKEWDKHAFPPRVGILGARTIDTYVGIVAACWAGATYVPLGSKIPKERLISIMSMCDLSAIIADAEGARLLSEATICPPVVIAPDAMNISKSIIANTEFVDVNRIVSYPVAEPTMMRECDTGYIIFTSGTTGVPKGVMINLGSAKNYIENVVRILELTSADRFLCMCELTFDPSIGNMFGSWMVGGTHYIIQSNRVMNAIKFALTSKITVWSSTPSVVGLLRQVKLLHTSLPHLRMTIFGGEQLTKGVVEAWQTVAPKTVIYNVYGPTEVAAFTHAQRVTYPISLIPGRDSLPIGTPLPGCEAAVLDESGNAVPDGIQGELAMTGVQLAIGYLNEPKMTAERFPTLGGKRWYLTGDLAVREPSGIFQCLGRVDNQVKVLGNRIELEEIDSHLRTITKIDLVGTVTWPVVDGVAQGLVAFVAAKNIDSKYVISELKKRVPAYMLPGEIFEIEQMPFSQNGKIDRKALRRILESR